MAFRPDAPAAAQSAVHELRGPDRRALNAPRERDRPFALDDEWTWFACTENCTMRKRDVDARFNPRRKAANIPSLRTDGRPSIARRVTCTGWRAQCGARVRSGTPGRGAERLRPAPERRPPQVRNWSASRRNSTSIPGDRMAD